MLNGKRGLVRASSKSRLRLIDAVLFDCDGVLIDSRASYDRAIEMTVAHFLSDISGLNMKPKFPIYELVDYLRRTGQFNNDIDTTAAILVSILVNLPSQPQDAFGSEAFMNRVLTLLEMASHGFPKFVQGVRASSPNSASRIEELLERLSYPGNPKTSLLRRVFNEYYYGPVLLRQLCGLAPVVGRKTALIDAEKVIVSADTLRSLSSLLSSRRIGIVSGRSRLGTEYTVGELGRFFQDGPTAFLEDEEANAGAGEAFRGKPDPEPLLHAAAILGNSNGILYVGDSAEDLLMTQNANLRRPSFSFCGVTATARGPSRTSMLAERGADAILESVNDLPALLSSIR